MNIKRFAFVGLGVMGFPMAGHVSKAGFNTRVYNRTTEKALSWLTHYNGELSSSPRLASEGCDVVAICVGNDDDVRSVVFGENGILAGMNPGSVLVDHTTTSAELAEELHKKCASKGIYFVDAPVSGGQSGAENGTLTIMCGGDNSVIESISPILNCYASKISVLGRAGQGQRCKMVNQICIAGILQGLSEALLLAKKANLNITEVVNTLQYGAAGSWQMENRAETMNQQKFDFGFAIDWMHKDLTICLNEARRNNLDLQMTKEVLGLYDALRVKGLGRMDTSVLIKAYAE